MSVCLTGKAFLLGAQPPTAQTLELWDAATGHSDVTQVENTVLQWLHLIPLLFESTEQMDMSPLTLELLEVRHVTVTGTSPVASCFGFRLGACMHLHGPPRPLSPGPCNSQASYQFLKSISAVFCQASEGQGEALGTVLATYASYTFFGDDERCLVLECLAALGRAAASVPTICFAACFPQQTGSQPHSQAKDHHRAT